MILLDTRELPIERPKKTKAILFGKEKTMHVKDADFA